MILRRNIINDHVPGTSETGKGVCLGENTKRRSIEEVPPTRGLSSPKPLCSIDCPRPAAGGSGWPPSPGRWENVEVWEEWPSV